MCICMCMFEEVSISVVVECSGMLFGCIESGCCCYGDSVMLWSWG